MAYKLEKFKPRYPPSYLTEQLLSWPFENSSRTSELLQKAWMIACGCGFTGFVSRWIFFGLLKSAMGFNFTVASGIRNPKIQTHKFRSNIRF